jgi:hypothetical protein
MPVVVDARMEQRGTHPRPQLQRARWRSLDGPWEFALDPSADQRGPDDIVFDRIIEVPYPPESAASGIEDPGYHAIMWYRREVELEEGERTGGLLLHFGAVDYHARVWVNGKLVVEHEGGHTPFTADISQVRGAGRSIEIVVRAEDDPHDLAKPRGKQDWLAEPHEIWYPRTSGIWQTVWLEPVPAVRIEQIRWTPHLDRWEIGLEVALSEPAPPGTALRVVMHKEGVVLVDDTYGLSGVDVARRIALSDPGIEDYRNNLLWSPANPALIEAELELRQDGQLVDTVWSYTALRSVGVQGNRFMLNGRPYYLRMVLDQGYWPDTLLAPPSPAALRRDVELAIELGFNGVRKHQKLEDPRWLYWCDRLGLLVWVEMPSPYRFTPLAVERLVGEWIEAVRRDLSHPCVASWVPLNESWGVPDLPVNPAHRDYVRALYHLTKTLDPTRPVVGNDGWEHVATDIVTIHDYASSARVLAERYATPEAVSAVLMRQQPGGRPLTLHGFTIDEHPVVLSEFGGIALLDPDSPGWGYSRVSGSAQLLAAYTRLLEAVHGARGLAGFCFTQLTDVFQEKNGLATADRLPKVDPARIAAVTRSRRRAQAMDVDPEPEPEPQPKPHPQPPPAMP